MFACWFYPGVGVAVSEHGYTSSTLFAVDVIFYEFKGLEIFACRKKRSIETLWKVIILQN